MMKRGMVTLLIAAGLAAPVLAQEPPANPTNSAEKKICRRNETTGSRMGSGRTCKTRAEWERLDGAARKDLETYERQGGRPISSN